MGIYPGLLISNGGGGCADFGSKFGEVVNGAGSWVASLVTDRFCPVYG